MTAIADYRLDPGTTGIVEMEASAVMLVHAYRAKRTVVEMKDAGADDYTVGLTAASQILQQQIAEALRDGRLTITYPAAVVGSTPEGQKDA